MTNLVLGWAAPHGEVKIKNVGVCLAAQTLSNMLIYLNFFPPSVKYEEKKFGFTLLLVQQGQNEGQE